MKLLSSGQLSAGRERASNNCTGVHGHAFFRMYFRYIINIYMVLAAVQPSNLLFRGRSLPGMRLGCPVLSPGHVPSLLMSLWFLCSCCSQGVILEVSHPASAKVVKPELQEKVIAMLRQLLLSSSLPAGTLEAVKEAVSTKPFALTFINTKI